MSLLQEVQKIAVKNLNRKVPEIRAGYTVRVHQKIKEGGKERIQIFEGLVIKVNSGFGADKTFTVRKIVDGIGVEKVFPLYLPTLEKIEVKKSSKVRRAKLYYMRKRSGKSARLKDEFMKADALRYEGMEAEPEPAPEPEKSEDQNTETPAPEAKAEEKKEEPKQESAEKEVKEEKSENKEVPKEDTKES